MIAMLRALTEKTDNVWEQMSNIIRAIELLRNHQKE
jgi:hypothetical protein